MRFPRICDGKDEETGKAGRYMYYFEEKEVSFSGTQHSGYLVPRWSNPVCRVEPPGMIPVRRFCTENLIDLEGMV